MTTEVTVPADVDLALAAEVEHRNATLEDVNKKLGIVDLLAVPWEEESDKVMWRGEPWRERFKRGAFDGLEGHAGRLQVNREHVKGDTVGRVVATDPKHPRGLFTRVKMFSTPRGQETLTLADEGGAFPSIGYRVKSFADMRLDKRTRSREILRAFMDHLAFVEDPAYTGAEVLAVRAGQTGLTVAERPLPSTPTLDELMSDPLLAWAASRLDHQH